MFNWFAFLTYAVITAATPGPNNIMSMSNGGGAGWALRDRCPLTLAYWLALLQ